MRPSLPATTKRRRSRITARQAAALEGGSTRLVRVTEDAPGVGLAAIPELLALLDDHSAWIVDIGFGTGEPVERSAIDEPTRSIIAIDLHTPGIGDLVRRIEDGNLTNVVVVEADARYVLPAIPSGRLSGARTFFPDPWPKKRHHRRRLVNEDFALMLARCLQPGGFWHLATDWPDYADQIETILTSSDQWLGGRILRPEHRPVTRYERHAIAAGRSPVDLWFERTTA